MRNLLDELLESAGRICDAAREATPKPAPEWPPQVVVGHLIDVDIEVWRARIALMVNALRNGEAAPELAWWEPDPADTFDRYAHWPVEDALNAFIQGRRFLIAEANALTESERSAYAVHATFGRIDIPALLLEAIKHDEEHADSFRS